MNLTQSLVKFQKNQNKFLNSKDAGFSAKELKDAGFDV
ncbi:hypothetical Protein pso3_02590 [Candidatus Phytoplasma solani]